MALPSTLHPAPHSFREKQAVVKKKKSKEKTAEPAALVLQAVCTHRTSLKIATLVIAFETTQQGKAHLPQLSATGRALSAATSVGSDCSLRFSPNTQAEQHPRCSDPHLSFSLSRILSLSPSL